MTDSEADAASDQPAGADERDAFLNALSAVGRPLVTASRYAQLRGCSQAEASDRLAALAAEGALERHEVADDPVVWYPAEWQDLTSRERVVVFPERRTVVVDQPTQFTRAQLAQFAHLTDTTSSGAYRYEIRREDVWQAPYDNFADLRATMRDALGEAYPGLEEWAEDQWRRANQFVLRTHEEGYVVLTAETADLMGNVARERLNDGQLRAPIDETTSWVAEDRLAEVKRVLYEAGYPVRDERDLAGGDDLPVDLDLELRPYQQEWVDRFLETKSGVLVGPPGSGKTVATMGVLAELEGETLILVPGRELAGQWREELLANTSLTDEQVGEYHGGQKQVRPVTIATYQTAGMDRHRQLFGSREWGLVVYDEVHHIPAPVHRRSADLQSRARLGLSVDGDTMIPIRRDGTVEMVRIKTLAAECLGPGPGAADVQNVETLAVTDSGEVRWTSIHSVMRHRHGGRMFEIRARNGRKLTVTPDHSLMVFDGDLMQITSKPPGQLTETDYLLQPVSVPKAADSTSSIDIMELIDEGYVLLDDETPDKMFQPLYERSIGDNKSRYNWKSRKNLPLDVAREIDFDRRFIKGVYIHKRDCYIPPSVAVEDFARLVGLFVADGAFDEHRVEFYATDTDDTSEVSAFEEIIRAVCPDAHISKIANGENCCTLRVSGPLRSVLASIGLQNGARQKHVPPAILSNKSAYEAFVEGIVLGDGHRQERERNRVMTTISTSSKRLRAGLSFILAALGHTGGNYERETTVPIREGSHDTVPNNLVRFNPNRSERPNRSAMIPFTERLREAYDNVTRRGQQRADGGTSIESGLTNRQRLNSKEFDALVERSDLDCEWLRETDVAMLEVDAVEAVESEEFVYDISTEEENFLGNTLFCHNSSTPVREDDREEEIYTLVGPPIGTDWDALFEAGYVAEPEVEIRYVPFADEAADAYAGAEGAQRRQVAASNPAKVAEVEQILGRHPDTRALVFVEYLDQGRELAAALDAPFVSGETPHARREKLFEGFREGRQSTLVVSRVGDEGIDLPNAEVAVVASGLGGSRRQGAQRAGRTMRPTGSARMYVLATRGTREEEFARQRTRHLAEKGVQVRERDSEQLAEEETETEADTSADRAG